MTISPSDLNVDSVAFWTFQNKTNGLSFKGHDFSISM